MKILYKATLLISKQMKICQLQFYILDGARKNYIKRHMEKVRTIWYCPFIYRKDNKETKQEKLCWSSIKPC